LLRSDRISLGLPLAYLGGLLLDHLPGAFAHIVHPRALPRDDAVVIGIQFAAIGCVCFVAGVWGARAMTRAPRQYVLEDRGRFALFCLIGGWIFVYGLSPIGRFPSLGALIDKGGAIWILGTLLGLRGAFESKEPTKIGLWTAGLLVYPILGLVLGGFLGSGSAAMIVACSVLAISARSYGRAVAGVALAIVVGLNIFVNYFEHRTDIRNQVWGGASLEQKIHSVSEVFTNFHEISPENPKDMDALDERLNQNFFVGVAAQRLHDHETDYLYGGSLLDGVLSVIPRAFWPDKPIEAGSGRLVAEATGLQLSETTSWGVGNVLEFYINFGMPGLVSGFLLLGWLLGRLDFLAASAERRGDFEATIGIFLPAVALIQPGGSVVEMMGGAAAALAAAFVWKRVWRMWRHRGRRRGDFVRVPVTRVHGEPLS
jgi:hypothetical protein